MKSSLKFSSNALIVLQKRYLKKNNAGEVIETPEELLKRVSGAIASIEKKYGANEEALKKVEKDFFEMMRELEFMPNSPTLMNAGKDLGQLSACFIKEQKILSNLGYKNIDQIEVGDKVITDRGRAKEVLELHQRKYRGKLYAIDIQGLMRPGLSVTEEHPILAVKKENLVCKRMKNKKCNGFIKKYCLKIPGEYKRNCEFIGQFFEPKWIPVKKLEKGDFVVVNTNREIKDIKEIKIEDYLKDNIYLKKGDCLIAKGRPNEGKNIPNRIGIDNDFLRLIGQWLADGSLSKRYDKYSVIRFTFNLKEKEFCEEIRRTMKKKFNLTAKEEFTEKQKTIQIRFSSIIVAELFYKLFGKGFNGKRLPAWVITLPLEKQFNLLVGLFRGDGCYSKEKRQDRIFVSLSNEKLANDVWNVLLRLRYNFNITHRRPRGATEEAYRIGAAPSECKQLVEAIKKGKYRERKIFPRYIKTGNVILRPIDRIECKPFDGDVYNLEVEEDHSYLANGVAVHNCFVLPVADSMESIFDAIKSTALIHQSGGGTGFSFSRLRPKNSIVKSTGGVASGPVSFMKVFDAATHAVVQGGMRRGANMGILSVDHPDILEFIKCKEKEGDISNFNISIALTDDFMEKVLREEKYELRDPRSDKVVGELDAKEVFDLIAVYAHRNGEPGIIFIDKMNKHNPTPALGKYESTNPCGEQILLPYESCNLGSINLSKMIKEINGKFETDWDRLKRVTIQSVRFLDNVIDCNKFPLSQIETSTLKTRKIGLGVMGWATMLGFLGIPYDSEEAINLAKKVMSFIQDIARGASLELAKERGVFPAWEGSTWHKKNMKMRNATLTTIAPTGTISIIAGPTSSGVEPNFSLCYFRNVLDGEKLLEADLAFEWTAKKQGFYSKELMKRVASGESIQGMKEVPDKVKRIFRTAMDISAFWHIKMQGVFQEYTDNAVSKTINFSNDAKVEDIKEAYLLAYKVNCKGITVYRDGSRKVQVLTIDKKKEGDKSMENKEIESYSLTVPYPKPRPEVILGTTTKVNTGCGNLYITVNQDEEGNFFEVFTQMGKAGGCAASQLEAVGRLVSLALRGGIDVKVIVEQLKGIRCPSPSWDKGKKIFSCADAIARVLEKRASGQKEEMKVKVSFVQEEAPVGAVVGGEHPSGHKYASPIKVNKNNSNNVVGVCIECGFALRHQEGCLVCDACGYSKC
ncbi:MAG: vitamin B12-dependent ribonucleotide reductase [Candidatus Omnitrophota bacterium]